MLRTLLASLVVSSTAALAQQPMLQISGANFRPVPLALAAPASADGVPRAAAQRFDQTLLFDLTAAGIFQVLDRKSFLADAKEGITAASIDFSRWSDVGAEMLVKTQLSMEGESLRGELRLFSVGQGKEELKTSHAVPTAEARQLAHHLANALYKHFTRETGPFLTTLTFVRKNGANKDVVVSDWDGENLRAVATGNINVLPAFSPDGTVGFTSYRRGKPDIYVARPGSEPRSIVSSGQMATGVAFSPDGRRIAYSQAAGEGAQLWVSSADGSGGRQLTRTPFFINSSPSWSPDGKRLAFVSNRGGSPQIYVMNADGSGVKRLTFQGNYNQTPDWSPRGDLIAFTARDERNAFDLFTVNVENGKVTRLTQDQGNNEEPSFSPNGRLIVFSSTRKGSPSLYVMTADGSNQVALPMDRGSYTTPDWGL